MKIRFTDEDGILQEMSVVKRNHTFFGIDSNYANQIGKTFSSPYDNCRFEIMFNSHDSPVHTAFKGTVDLNSLLEQKKTLVGLRDNTDNEEIYDHIQGVISLLDAIHDSINPPESIGGYFTEEVQQEDDTIPSDYSYN